MAKKYKRLLGHLKQYNLVFLTACRPITDDCACFGVFSMHLIDGSTLDNSLICSFIKPINCCLYGKCTTSVDFIMLYVQVATTSAIQSSLSNYNVPSHAINRILNVSCHQLFHCYFSNTMDNSLLSSLLTTS